MPIVVNNNPLFGSQWYLKNTGQRGAPGVDINVTEVWSDYTGKGIVVAINDDGMDLSHPDLAGNILQNLVYDSGRKTTGEGFVSNADNSHGTVVGSIIGMLNNGEGGIGVAYGVRLVPHLTIGTGSGGDSAAVFSANLAANVHVSTNSWGSDPAFSENFSASQGSAADQAWGTAMLAAITTGRAGLGMVIEVSGGNERGNKADTALSNFTSARYTIAVGSVDHLGKPTEYSTPGASLLVTAPGGVASEPQSVNAGFGVVSADVAGAKGYNTTEGTGGDYAFNSQGTSYSGPMVAGVTALMLEANPKLGFRDVANILALTARQTDAGNASWVTNAGTDWNLGGMHFSRDFGYGLVDAKAAVHLAESWQLAAATAANWRSVQSGTDNEQAAIPEGGINGHAVKVAVASNVRIERIEVDLEIDASAPGQLRATLTSPGGTTITLFDQPLSKALKDGAPDAALSDTAWPGVFTIGVTAFLGESSAGTWTVQLFDMVTGVTATYKSVAVRAWGTEIGTGNNYVFTDEMSGARDLSDAAGIDTINGAALSAAAIIDLGAGATSRLGKGEVRLGANTTIENAIGGDGADTLTGNAQANVLRGNRGDDAINGGAGVDIAQYTFSKAQYTITKTGSGFTVKDNGNSEGIDSLTGIERLKFADGLFALDVGSDGIAGQAYRIYQAAFNRTPDAGGLGYWIGVMDGGSSLSTISGGFINSTEFRAAYGSAPTNEQLVTRFYQNILHREPEKAGYDFWVGVLNGNHAPLADVLAAISESNENQVAVAAIIGNGFGYVPFGGV